MLLHIIPILLFTRLLSYWIGKAFREAGVPVTEALIVELLSPKNLILPPGSEFEVQSKHFNANDFNKEEVQRCVIALIYL